MSLQRYSAAESPLRVFGMPLFNTTGEWRRLPEWVIEQVPRLEDFRYTANGARVGFRTDASEFTVRCRMRCMISRFGADHSLLALTGINVYAGNRSEARYLGYLCMPSLSKEFVTIEKTFSKNFEDEDVILYLAGWGSIEQLEILVDETASVTEPTPYRYARPVVFYGSSITAGGAASRAANTYESLLSRWLDFDFLNLGFAGNARGDLPIADYIRQIDMSVFVYDYDHNARTVSELQATHKPFFDRIRERNPDLPVIMLTRPYGDTDPEDTEKRRNVVYATYQAALDGGDANVYFIDGQTMLGREDRHACTVDLIHPNDLGLMRMAKAIYPVLKKALETADRIRISQDRK